MRMVADGWPVPRIIRKTYITLRRDLPTLAIQERESDYHKYHDKNYQNYHYITTALALS